MIIINFAIAGIIFLPIVFAILKRKKRFPLKVEEGAYILHMPQWHFSLVEQKPYGLLGHIKSGRCFVIDKDAIGFDIIYKQFRFLGKTGCIPQKEDITITRDRQGIIGSAVAALFFIYTTGWIN